MATLTATTLPALPAGNNLPRARSLLANLVLVAIIPVVLAPVVWILLQSFFTESQALRLPPVWVTTSLTSSNYTGVFDQIPFFTFLFNSIKITLIVTLGSLATSSLAAYAFARLRFPGRDVLFLFFLSALMVPNQVTAAPTYLLMHHLGLASSQVAVWLPGLVNVFGIFLLRQFFQGLPRDLEDAARLDGLGTLSILWRIILPLSKQALAALAILVGAATWNDYFWPSIFLSRRSDMTLPVGLVSLQGQYKQGSPLLMFAAISMTVGPLLVVFLFAQRSITQSLAMTGFK